MPTGSRATSWAGSGTPRGRAAQLALDVWSLLTRFFARNNRAECLGLLAILVTGFLLVRDDAASVGEVTAATLLFHRLFNPVGALVVLFDEVQSAGASLTRLAGVALMPMPDEPPETARPPRSAHGRRPHP